MSTRRCGAPNDTLLPLNVEEDAEEMSVVVSSAVAAAAVAGAGVELDIVASVGAVEESDDDGGGADALRASSTRCR